MSNDYATFEELLNKIKELEKMVDKLFETVHGIYPDDVDNLQERISKLEKKVDGMSNGCSLAQQNLTAVSKLENTNQQLIQEILPRDYLEKELSELKEQVDLYNEKCWIPQGNDIAELKERVEGIFKSIHGVSPDEVDNVKKEITELKEELNKINILYFDKKASFGYIQFYNRTHKDIRELKEQCRTYKECNHIVENNLNPLRDVLRELLINMEDHASDDIGFKSFFRGLKDKLDSGSKKRDPFEVIVPKDFWKDILEDSGEKNITLVHDSRAKCNKCGNVLSMDISTLDTVDWYCETCSGDKDLELDHVPELMKGTFIDPDSGETSAVGCRIDPPSQDDLTEALITDSKPEPIGVAWLDDTKEGWERANKDWDKNNPSEHPEPCPKCGELHWDMHVCPSVHPEPIEDCECKVLVNMVCVDCGKKHLTPSEQDAGSARQTDKRMIISPLRNIPIMGNDGKLYYQVEKEHLEWLLEKLTYYYERPSGRYQKDKRIMDELKKKFLSEQTEKPLTFERHRTGISSWGTLEQYKNMPEELPNKEGKYILVEKEDLINDEVKKELISEFLRDYKWLLAFGIHKRWMAKECRCVTSIAEFEVWIEEKWESRGDQKNEM